jgi:methionyl-tRNA formyltransferase
MRTVMLGTGSFAEPTFLALARSRHRPVALVTNPDRPSGKEREMVRPIKKLALEENIPVFQPESVNSPEGLAGLRQFQPELLVVAAYGQILSAEVLAAARQGGINLHASLLPKYRGAAPVAWAIFHGETQTGVSVIRMTPRLDAGDILAQKAVDILPQETAGELEARLANIGAELILAVVDQIEAGTAQGWPQDPARVSRAPKLTKEHGLVDWSRPARLVCCQIRAMQPWPSPYTYWHRRGKPPLRLLLLQAQAEESASPPQHTPPGTVLHADQQQILIAAGQGAVRPLVVQPAGKTPMSIADFLHGHPVQVGDRFGPETLPA